MEYMPVKYGYEWTLAWWDDPLMKWIVEWRAPGKLGEIKWGMEVEDYPQKALDRIRAAGNVPAELFKTKHEALAYAGQFEPKGDIDIEDIPM